MADEGTLQAVAEELTLALRPLQYAAADLDQFAAFMERLGFGATSVPPEFTALANAVEKAETDVVALQAAPDPEKVKQVLDDVSGVYNAITQIQQAPAGVNAADYLAEIPERLFEYLLIEYLRARTPRLCAVLLVLDVLRVEPGDTTGGRPEYAVQRLRLKQLSKILEDPAGLPEWIYGWGTQDFDFLRLLDNTAEFARAFRLPISIDPIDDDQADAYKAAVAGQTAPEWKLSVPIKFVEAGTDTYELGVQVVELPAEGAKPPGIAIQPDVPEEIGVDVQLTDNLKLVVRAGTNLAETMGILIRPGELSVAYPFQPGTTLPSAGFGASLDYAPPEPKTLIGQSEGTRLELAGGSVGTFVETDAGQFEFKLEIQPRGMKAVVTGGDQDGFLSTILSALDIEVEIPIGLNWSSRTGIALAGGSEFEVTFSPHIELGPIGIEQLEIGLKPGHDPAIPTLNVDVGLGLSGTFGPFAMVVNGIGMRLSIAFKDGNAGPFDIGAGFKPPHGLGMVLDATAVKGGGYLDFDFEEEQYAGVLELSIQELIQIKVVGLLTTRLPGGQEGFSLLLIVTAQFPPIQLGYGFALTGLGGLAGVNRTLNAEALRSGVRNGTVGSIMFPEDPVKNATKLIADVKAVFPPQQDRYVFGPMAEIGWGSPPIITAQIGIVLELPMPIKLAILGRIKAVLPDEDAAVVKIHLDSVGIIEFEKSSLSVDASLYDSQIVAYALAGDMALRLNWGQQPTFALSVGGLHPSFKKPPPGFPSLRRLSLTMGDGENPRLACETYIAITANSAQFGAHLEAKVSAGGYGVHGYLGFDVLFIFSPFSMRADMNAGVDLLQGNSVLMTISLSFTLTGPSPWHACGTATAHILFFDVSVAFDAQWGDPVQALLAQLDALKPLIDALGDPGNWSAIAPSEAERCATLGSSPLEDGTVMVHPLGRLTVRQKVVPLEIQISLFGSAAPAGWDTFRISDVALNGTAGQPRDAVQDQFARGQFFAMTDDEKLSKDSYERHDSGMAAGSDQIKGGASSSLDAEYETKLVTNRVLPAQKRGLYKPNPAAFTAAIRHGAGERSPVLNSGREKFSVAGAGSAVSVDELSYVVAQRDDLAVRTDVLTSSSTQVAADVALAQHLLDHPEDEGVLQVLPAHEAA